MLPRTPQNRTRIEVFDIQVPENSHRQFLFGMNGNVEQVPRHRNCRQKLTYSQKQMRRATNATDGLVHMAQPVGEDAHDVER